LLCKEDINNSLLFDFHGFSKKEKPKKGETAELCQDNAKQKNINILL